MSEASRRRGDAIPLGRHATTAIVLDLFLGVGALGGGAALMVGPQGEIIPLPVSALTGSPFANYFVPGAILFVMLGIAPLAAAVLTWRRHRVAPLMAFVVGAVLLTWLVVQIAIIGYSNNPPLQAMYLALGISMTLLGLSWLRDRGVRLVRKPDPSV
jgi:hypothetical protein